MSKRAASDNGLIATGSRLSYQKKFFEIKQRVVSKVLFRMQYTNNVLYKIYTQNVTRFDNDDDDDYNNYNKFTLLYVDSEILFNTIQEKSTYKFSGDYIKLKSNATSEIDKYIVRKCVQLYEDDKDLLFIVCANHFFNRSVLKIEFYVQGAYHLQHEEGSAHIFGLLRSDNDTYKQCDIILSVNDHMSSYCFIKPYDNEYTRLKKLYQMVYEGLLNKWCIVSNVMTIASNSLFYLIANKNTHIRTSYYENNNDSPITNYGCNMSYKIETKLMFNVTEKFPPYRVKKINDSLYKMIFVFDYKLTELYHYGEILKPPSKINPWYSSKMPIFIVVYSYTRFIAMITYHTDLYDKNCLKHIKIF